MRRPRKPRPTVPVWFVEEQLIRRSSGTAAGCLAPGFSLPKRLDEAYESLNPSTFFRRVGGLFGVLVRTLRARDEEEAETPTGTLVG